MLHCACILQILFAGNTTKTVGEYSDLIDCLDFTMGRAITWRGTVEYESTRVDI